MTISRPTTAAMLLCALCWTSFFAPTANGQEATLVEVSEAGQETAKKPEKEPRKFRKKPLWLMWHTGFTEGRALSYIREVSERTGVDKNMTERMKEEFNKERPMTRPVKGTAMFMVNGLIPGVETLDFRALDKGETLDQLITKRKQQWGGGPSSTITGVGSLRKLEVKQEWSYPKQKREKVDGKWVTKPVLDKDGKPVMEKGGWTRATYFRVENGVVFEGTFPEVHDMELPNADGMGVGRRARKEDLYFHADLTLVPKGMKSIFFGIVTAEVNTALQRRDTEELIPYKFRKSTSKMVLELMRSLIFDVDEASGYIKLATDTEPVRARFNMKARSGSKLGKQLRDLGRTRARLPVDQDAVISVRSSWAMPKLLREVLETAGPQLRVIADRDIKNDDASQGLHDLALAIERTGRDGNAEAFVSFGGSEASGPVLYGAVRAEKGDNLTTGIRELLDYAMTQVNEPNLPKVSPFEGGRHDYARLSLEDMPWPGDMKPSAIYITSGNGAVWFAAGKDNAFEVLEEKVNAKVSRRGRSTLLDVQLDLNRMMDKEDPAGLGKLGSKLDVEVERMLMASSLSFIPEKFRTEFPDPPKLLDKVLADGGRKLSLVVDADQKGLVARAKVDEPLARYLVARFISIQMTVESRMREYQQKMQEETTKKAQEAAKEAAAAAKEAIRKREADTDSK